MKEQKKVHRKLSNRNIMPPEREMKNRCSQSLKRLGQLRRLYNGEFFLCNTCVFKTIVVLLPDFSVLGSVK